MRKVERMHLRKARVLPSSRIPQIDVSNELIDSTISEVHPIGWGKGDSPTVAGHRWVVAVRG